MALQGAWEQACIVRRHVQKLPVEAWAGVGLAARGNIGMADNVFHRIGAAQEGKQCAQLLVLLRHEFLPVAAFQFDAERKIVAARTSAPCGLTGMPGASLARDELDQLAIAPDQEVRRNAQAADASEIGMGVRVEAIGEQPDDVVAAKLFRWQADGMDDDQ